MKELSWKRYNEIRDAMEWIKTHGIYDALHEAYSALPANEMEQSAKNDCINIVCKAYNSQKSISDQMWRDLRKVLFSGSIEVQIEYGDLRFNMPQNDLVFDSHTPKCFRIWGNINNPNRTDWWDSTILSELSIEGDRLNDAQYVELIYNENDLGKYFISILASRLITPQS